MSRVITFGGAAAAVNPDFGYEAIGWNADGTRKRITASASTHTKGTYGALTRPDGSTLTTASAWCGFFLDASDTGSTGGRFLVDIRINNGGANPIIVPDIVIEHGGINGRVWVPLQIPAGSQLEARCQAAAGSATVRVGLHGVPASATGAQPGFATMNAIVAGDTSITKASATFVGITTAQTYTQLIASTAALYGALMVNCGIGTAAPAVIRDCTLILATGGAGSEVEIARFGLVATPATPCFTKANFIVSKSIPAGTRIAAAVMGPTADNGPAVQLYGFN